MPKSAYTVALVLAALSIAIAVPSNTRAQQSKLDDPYIAAKLTLGFGGSTGGTWQTAPLRREEPIGDSLGVSFGLAGQYLYPLHTYFSVGGLFGFQSWRSTRDGDAGRNLVFDLAVLPQGKYELIKNQLELNVSTPIGLALNMLNEFDQSNDLVVGAPGSAVAKLEGNTAVGFVIGFLIGARYQLLDSVGLLAELGYIYRSVAHTRQYSVSGSNGGTTGSATSEEYDIDIHWGQVALNLGAYF